MNNTTETVNLPFSNSGDVFVFLLNVMLAISIFLFVTLPLAIFIKIIMLITAKDPSKKEEQTKGLIKLAIGWVISLLCVFIAFTGRVLFLNIMGQV